MPAMPDEPKPNVDRDDADLPEASAVEKADVDLGQKMASHRDDPLVKAAGYAGKLGDQAPLYALSAGLLVVGLAAPRAQPHFRDGCARRRDGKRWDR